MFCKRLINVRQLISKDYYDLLDFNKKLFNKPNEEDDIQLTKKGGASNHRDVKLRIEFAIKEGRLTDIQEEYLKKVLKLYDSGSILNETSKKIKDEIAKTMDSLEVYKSVKNNIPETYFQHRETKRQDEKLGEIILSEVLIKG